MHCTYSLFLGTQIKKQRIPLLILKKYTGVPVIKKSKIHGIRTKASVGTAFSSARYKGATRYNQANSKEKHPCLVPKNHRIYFSTPFQAIGNQTEAFLCKVDVQFCILALSHLVFPLPWQKNMCYSSGNFRSFLKNSGYKLHVARIYSFLSHAKSTELCKSPTQFSHPQVMF